MEKKAIELEEETKSKVSHSLSAIEVALAEWESSKKKPAELKKRMGYLKESHRALSRWMKDSLKGKLDLPSIAERLRNFSEICVELEKARPE